MDHDADRAAGIQTVAVRRGVRFATACSAVLFAAFYVLVALYWTLGWWTPELAVPFLAGAVLHLAIFATLRPWRDVLAAQRYGTIYRFLFVICAGLALLGWWSRAPSPLI
jgi:4-hydroxybenzoate polyprenyltransferase